MKPLSQCSSSGPDEPKAVRGHERSCCLALATTVILHALGGCTLPAATDGIRSAPPVSSSRPAAMQVVLTTAELGMAGPTASLYEALRALQPEVVEWNRSLAAFRSVYVDGVRVSFAVLREIPCSRVRKVRLVSAGKEPALLAPGDEAGVIVVTTGPVVEQIRRLLPR